MDLTYGYFTFVVHMQEGTAQVRSILGPEVAISDKDIQDSLWHYYYDIERTVTYLLSVSRSLSVISLGL